MGIEQICNTVKNVFKTTRPPTGQLNRILLVCSMIKRPGLSAIVSTSNIIKDLNKLGFNTAPMPDGSENKTVTMVFSIVKEIFRAITFDMSIQCGDMPGGTQIMTNTGGGVNLTTGQGFAHAH